MAKINCRRNDNRSHAYYEPILGGGRDDYSHEGSRDCSPTNTRNGPVIYATAAKVYTMGGHKKPLPVPIGHRMLKFYLDLERKVDPHAPALA